ncbi:MAG TPA: DUF190 domain-containing protein, partial [Chloroflexia bacterium]|nr:DUF190 domain-containing protein [Chloroflexia bacterium]
GAGATVLKGAAGYSAAGRMIHASTMVDVPPHLPLVILIVDEAARIAALVPVLEEMLAAHGGLIGVVDLAAYRYRHPDRPAAGGQRKVAQIMETQVVTVPPEMPVADLLPLLLHKSYKALPVVDGASHVLGMVTDGDLLKTEGLGLHLSVLEALQAQGGADYEALVRSVRASGKTARDVMGSRPEAVIGPDASVADAARRMVQQGVKRLPVVDRDGRLLGIVGRLDVLKAASHVTPSAGPEPEPPLPAGAQTLREVMLTDVLTVAADTPLAQVVDTLVGSRGARRLVVTGGDDGQQVVGIITDADLARRVSAPGRPGLVDMLLKGLQLLGTNPAPPMTAAGGGTAADVMTTPAITAPTTLPIAEAIALMTEQGVKVLPVVDDAGRLAGIVNRARLLQALIGPPAGAA